MTITSDMQTPGAGTPAATTEPHSGSLADVLDVILDKGIVIDAFVRVSLVGIEILTVDARIVVASVDTYMHFAREANRLQMGGGGGSGKQGLAGMMGKLASGGAESMTKGALRGAGEGLREGLLPGKKEPQERHGVVQRAVGAIRDALTPDNGDDQQGQAQAGEGAGSQGSGGSPPASGRRRQQGGQQGQAGGASRRRAAPTSRRPPPRDPGD